MIINPARDSLNKKTTTNVDNNKEVKKNPTTNASDTIKTVKSNPVINKSTMLSSQTPTVMTKKTIEETKKGTENYAKQVQQQYKANIEQKANDRIEFNTANAMEHIDSINNDLTGETFFKYYNEDGTFKDNKATRDEKVKLRDEKKAQLLKNNQEFKPSSTNLAFNNAPNFINYNAEQQKLSDEIKQLDSEIDELDYVIEGQDAINEMAQTDYINKNGTAEEKEKYKKFLSTYNDTYLERLANAYGASVIDTINIPVQAVEILKTVGERNLEDGFDFTGKDSLSSYLTNQSNELRSYVFNGSEGFENWSLQTLSSLMPMMNSMLIGMGLGTIAGASGQALTNFTNTFTNVTLGVQNAGQVTRQRIEEGNDLVTSFWNGVIHGTISGLVEGADAGRVASIFTGDASKFLLGTALLSKAKPTEILGFLNAVGASEGAEEIIEAYADKIADDMQNAITGSTLQAEQINPSDLASQFVMAYAGALLMGAPTAFNVAIDSKAKFNGAMEARNYFMSAIDSSLTTQEEKQAYATIVQSIDNEINNYRAKSSPIQDAVSFSTDEVAPLGSFNEAMQILANGLRSDIQEQVAMAEQSIQKASDLQNQFQSALNGRGIDINANDYLNLSEQAKQNVKDVQNYGHELGINLGFDSSIAEDGYYDPNSRMIIINPNSKLGELSTLVHEITHGTEGSKFYDSLAQLIKDNYDGDINNEINRIKKLYANYNVNLDNVGAEREFVAKQTQNQLGNEEFVKMLVRYNNSLAYRLYRNIKEMADGDVKTQLENNFMKAFRENASDNGNIKFSITNMETTDEELSELKKIDLPVKEYKEIESAINSYSDIEKGLHYITMQGNYARGRYFFTTNGEYGSFTIVGKDDGQNIHRNNQPGWRRGVGSISLQSNENERAVRGNDELVSREQGNETNERLSSDKGFENPQFSISELEDKAIQEFGTTTNPYKAGFILPSGKMLDLSEGQNRRVQDHRTVGVLFDNLDYGRDGMSVGMIRFMNEGNIRLQPEGEGIDISNVIEPTNDQYSAIYDYYSTFRNDGFILDISDNNGDSVFSMEYAPGTSPSVAINDIKNYFNNGTIPKDTGLNATEREMARFFYGDRFQYSIPDNDENFYKSDEVKSFFGNNYNEISKNIETKEDAIKFNNDFKEALRLKPIWDENQKEFVNDLENTLKSILDVPFTVEDINLGKDYKGQTVVINPGAKSIKSAITKATSKKYDLGRMKDQNRVSINFPEFTNVDKLVKLVDGLKKHYNANVEVFDGSSQFGYTAVHLTFTNENGIKTEIQISPDFTTKIKSDSIYEKWRRYSDKKLSELQVYERSLDAESSRELWKSVGITPEVIDKIKSSLTELTSPGLGIQGRTSTQDLVDGSNLPMMSNPPSQTTNSSVSTSFNIDNPLGNANITAPPSYNNILSQEGDVEGLENPKNIQYSIPDDEYYDYGTKPVREVDILKETKYGPTSQATRTIANSQFVNKRTAKQMARDVKEGVYAYDETTNKADTEKAVSRIKELGYDNAIDEVMKNNNIDDAKVTVAMGRELIKEMERRGETKTKRFVDLSSRITYMGSMLGQGVQAYATFKTMTPQGQLITIQDDVNRIQEELKQRYGDRAPNISLDESLIEEYRNAKTQEQRDEVALKMAKAIADQVPPTIEEQLNSYRHLSMLFNPRTWIKNALSNTVWGYVSDVKRAVQTSIEGIASMNNENFERHAGVYNPFSKQDKAWYKKLVNDYNNNFKGFQGKYTSGDVGDIISKSNFGQLVQDNRKQFKSEFLNKVSDINSKMMSDAPAMRKAYAKTFIGYLKSNNLTLDNISQEQYDYIKEYSFNKAREITFNAENKLANDISNFANKGGKVRKIVVDSFIPFKRTPLNILAQGAKYTPLQLGKTIAYDLKQLKSGKITGTQFVDGLASGLTGTGIVMLGALLASMGVFRTGDDDKDRKKSFDEDNGEQDYAIVFDGGTYTIDWLDPLIMPLSIGAELVNNENIDDKDLIDIASSIFDPVFETSMLSGITNNLNSYSSEGYVWKLVQNIGSNYASQYIPTIGGAIARTLDGTRRTTYPNDGFVDKFVKQTLNKIPGASTLNQPYINKQGEEEKSEDLGFGVIGRAILNFLSPGYYSSNDIDKYDEELYRLYDETGEIDALPSSSSTSLTYNKENYKFTDEQYTEWHKVRWATEKKYVDEFIDSAKYKTLSDAERVATIKDIRTYAQQLAKKDFLESQGIEYNDSTYEKTQGALNAGIDIYEYFDYKNNAGKKQAEKVGYLKNSNLSNSQKEYLYGLEGYKTSYLEAYEKVMNKKKGITKQVMVQNKPISRNKKVVDKTVKVVKKSLPNGLKNASKTNQESYKQAYSRVLNRKRNK